jgi:hypothetical protein
MTPKFGKITEKGEAETRDQHAKSNRCHESGPEAGRSEPYLALFVAHSSQEQGAGIF